MLSDDFERIQPDEVYLPALSTEAVELHTKDELLAMSHEELVQHTYDLEHKVSTDPLTGLLNKSAWLERVDAMTETEAGHFGVVFIDLSKFKHVNDVLGHLKGDEILKKTGETLKNSLRHEDTGQMMHDIGRYGGDEFAVLCNLEPREGSTLPIEQRLEIIIERLREQFTAMVEEEGLGKLGFDMAIGGTIHKPGETSEDLLKQADDQMYADKYTRREKLTVEEIAKINAVRHILHKAGVRLPDELISQE